MNIPRLPLAARPAHRCLRNSVVAALLCLTALAAAAYISTVVFDRLPHTEDEIAFLFQARTIAAGQIVASAPALPDFFYMPFIIVRDGMWFGKYPPGYPAVLALGALAGQPWLINPLFGAATVGLVYLAGRRLYGTRTGLVAAALIVVSPFFLLQAGSFLSHVVSLFWAMAFLLLFESARSRHSRGAALLAGTALGMLFLSRPLTALGVVIPYIIWAAVDMLRERRRFFDYLPVALAFLPFLATLLAYNSLTAGNMFRTGYELWWPYDRIGFGPGIGADGEHTLDAALDSTQKNVDALASYLFGWPGSLGLLLPALGVARPIARVFWSGVSRAARSAKLPASRYLANIDIRHASQPEAWDILHLGVVVSLAAVYMAYWAAGQMYGPRYYFEALGALMLLSARGLVQTAGLVSWLLRMLVPAWQTGRSWVGALAVLVVFGLASNSLAGFVPTEFGHFVNWYNIEGSGLRQIQAAGLRNSVVFIPTTDWPQYAPFFSQNKPTLDGDVVYASDRGPERNAELMALFPGRKFYVYLDGRVEKIPR